MDFQELDQVLSLVNGKLTLAATSLPGAPLQALLSAYNGDQPLIIENAQKQTAADSVTVTGAASFMNVPSLPVTSVFHLDVTGTPVATLRFTLIGPTPGPNSWRFSTSFPNLPFFMDYGKSLTKPQLNLLDELQLSNAAFVLTTQAGRDDAAGIPLSVGLNFVGTLKPTGLTGLFDTLLQGDKQVTLYGTITMPVATEVTPPLPYLTYPWQTQWPLPGIQLQAALGTEFSISALKVHDTELRIYSPISSDWLAANRSYQPTTAMTGTLDVPSAAISVDVTAEITRNYPYVLIAGMFEGLDLDNLIKLADLANGSDLFDGLPDDIKKLINNLGGLTLEGAAVGLTNSLSASAIDYTYLIVGMPKLQWMVFPGFTIDSIFTDFIIDSPFSGQDRSVSVLVGGQMDVAGVPFSVSTEMPSFSVRAALVEGATLPLSDFFKQFLPELPAPPDLIIEEMQLIVVPGQEYSFTARMADDPGWTLDLGPTPLTISNVEISLSKQAAGSPQGTFDGTIELDQDLLLVMRYDLPGNFIIRADLPEIKLLQLISRLSEIGLTLPQGFDIDLKQSYVLIEKQDGGLTFSAATDVEGLGLLAFTAQKQGQWGFAVGVDLKGGLSALPGLGVLAAFESFVGLDTLLLVLSSLDQPGFQFPDMAHFNAPALGNQNIKLPAQANGLVRGVNFYAALNTTRSDGFRALARYLGVDLNGSVGITIAVSLPDPATNSKLFLSVNEEIQKGTTLSGELGGLLQGGDVGAFLAAIVKTQVQGQPIEFDVTAVVLENGVLISGTVQGTIHFDPAPVQLSNLALVIGLDFEGVPSLGIAATLDVVTFDSSVALFFDSNDPDKSLVAGAISNLTLLDVASTLAGQKSLPAGLDTVLGRVGLKDLSAFSMPATVGTALDGRDLGAISTAFQQYGKVAIPSTSDRILLVINEKGSAWHLTDMTTMYHYSLSRQGETISVDLQPQLYCVPGPLSTFIGSIQYQPGFDVIGEIDYLLLQAQVKVLISPNQGIAADVDVAPIVIVSQDFFAVTGAGGKGGPRLSLATYSQPNLTDVQLRGPHFLVSGNLRLLGVDMFGVYVSITEHGLDFKVAEQVNPLLHVDLHGNFDSLTNLDVGGGIIVGIDRTLDLGPLGHLAVNVDVNGSLEAGYKAGGAYATFQGGFQYQGIQGNIPKISLDVTGPALQQIGDTLWSQVSDILTKLLKNADQWLTWLHNGIIQGAGQTAEEVGKVLSNVYQLSQDVIATKTHQILGYGSQGVAEALKGAGATANDAARILKDMGYQTAEITTVIRNVFTHVNVNLGHIDTPGGPHVDAATKHVDVPRTHIDTTQHTDVPRTHIDTIQHTDVPRTHVDTTQHADIPGTHTDFGTVFGHADQNITPHGDSNPHVDQTTTPHGDTNPHVDQTTTPHGDTNPHVDQTTTPHGDTTTPHVDSQTPPHVDTSTHIDA